MKILDTLLKRFGYAKTDSAIQAFRAAYVAANNNRHREKHWADAAATDADTDLSSDLKTIRNRARLETRNNSYARGIAKIGANFIVGDGPRIQMKTENEEFNERFEQDFSAWSLVADASGRMSLADMLNLGESQLYPCGEYFMLTSNGRNRITDIDLRYRMIEPDRVKTPDQFTNDDYVRDGIRIDDDGRSILYYILKRHPGRNTSSNEVFDEWSPEEVIHETIMTRPEQTRGEPILCASLPLFADFRRFTNATLGAAEAAALFAVLLKSSSIGQDTAVEPEIWDLEPRSIAVLPPDTEPFQIKPEHPSTNFPQFKREFLSEVGAGAGMPYNVVAMDSSSHNYAAGRIDWQAFHQSITVRRNHIKVNVLSRIVGDFVDEWFLRNVGYGEEIKRQAYFMFDVLWPGLPHIDPSKEANAIKTLLDCGITTREDEWAKKGFDGRKKLAQWKREQELFGATDQSDTSIDQGIYTDEQDESEEE